MSEAKSCTHPLGCSSPMLARGLCRRHYKQRQRTEKYRHTARTPLNFRGELVRAAGPARPVDWNETLSEIRRAVPHSVVRVHDGGKVSIYPLCEQPRTFDSLDDALDALTAPPPSTGTG
jgi:hypothetical protein